MCLCQGRYNSWLCPWGRSQGKHPNKSKVSFPGHGHLSCFTERILTFQRHVNTKQYVRVPSLSYFEQVSAHRSPIFLKVIREHMGKVGYNRWMILCHRKIQPAYLCTALSVYWVLLASSALLPWKRHDLVDLNRDCPVGGCYSRGCSKLLTSPEAQSTRRQQAAWSLGISYTCCKNTACILYAAWIFRFLNWAFVHCKCV